MSTSSTSAPETVKDVSMVDVSNANSNNNQLNNSDESQPPPRRRSTMILTDGQDSNDSMTVDNSGSNNKSTSDASEEQQAQEQADQMLVDKPPADEAEKLKLDKSQSQHSHQPQQQQPQQQQQQQLPDPATTIPVDIKWVQGGEKVYVTGSFTGWRKMISLAKQPDNSFQITLGLPIGTHRFRFVVDNELRFSDFLPTATDQMGNFVNYAEVTPEHVHDHTQRVEEEQNKQREQEEDLERQREQQQREQQQSQQQSKSSPSPQPQSRSRGSSISRQRTDSAWGLTNDDDDMGGGYSRYHDEDGNGTNDPSQRHYNYINDIPPIFTDPKVMEQYYMAIDKQSKQQNGQQQAWLHPPQLPPHLDNVILNNFNSADKDNNSGALPIPNHVVLNHLATTSIKHNTLAVASVVRYKRKYVTQVLYAPLQSQPPPQPLSQPEPQAQSSS